MNRAFSALVVTAFLGASNLAAGDGVWAEVAGLEENAKLELADGSVKFPPLIVLRSDYSHAPDEDPFDALIVRPGSIQPFVLKKSGDCGMASRPEELTFSARIDEDLGGDPAGNVLTYGSGGTEMTWPIPDSMMGAILHGESKDHSEYVLQVRYFSTTDRQGVLYRFRKAGKQLTPIARSSGVLTSRDGKWVFFTGVAKTSRHPTRSVRPSGLFVYNVERHKAWKIADDGAIYRFCSWAPRS